MKKLALVVGIVAGLVLTAVPVSARNGDNQRFTVILSGRGEGAPDISRVVAAGPIRGAGTFEETDDEDVIRFVFPQGSLTLDAPSTEESEDFNERTCSGSFAFSGPFTIIDGTGVYADAKGSGTFQGRGRFVGTPSADGCSEEGFFFLVARIEGNVSVTGQAAA